MTTGGVPGGAQELAFDADHDHQLPAAVDEFPERVLAFVAEVAHGRASVPAGGFEHDAVEALQ